MFKLSKESKFTLIGLMTVPMIWIALNHFGYLDFIEYKSVDLRLKARGGISHRADSRADERIMVEDNKTVPRIPKVMYVNFDIKTLSMPEVGERPWNRTFFRDVGKILLEQGQARVVMYDFIFSPKATSEMVPPENVWSSDFAIAQLISDFPNQVVLATAYTGVVNPIFSTLSLDGAFKSSMPQLKRGYDPLKMGFRYPESPTYPIFSYENDKYLGLNGNIIVAPNDIDGMQRVVSLWTPGAGKAHAYNVLGGKMAKLGLEGEGFDSNATNQVKLAEVADELHLVWESNNSLIETLPNRMPLDWNRNFYTIGAEVLMAYYGVGEESVEMTEGNKRFKIKSLSGDLMVDAPMTDQQEMEINWFSEWKNVDQEKFEKARESFNDGDLSNYVKLALESIRLNLERVDGIKVSDNNSELIRVLSDLEVGESHIQTAKDLIKASDGKIESEEIPDFSRLEKVLGEISKNYLPPGLFSEFNPMCEMYDVLVYESFLSTTNNQIEIAKVGIFKMKGVLAGLRNMHYAHSDHNESKNLWTKITQLNPNKALESSKLMLRLDRMEGELVAFKSSLSQVDSNTSANRTERELVEINNKLKDVQSSRVLKAKLSNLKILQDKKLAIESEVNSLKKRVEQFPALSAVIQNTQLGPKEKELDELVKEMAKYDDISIEKLESKKREIEIEMLELQKRVEQFPALSTVIKSSQIDPKQKEIKNIEKRIATLLEVARGADLTNAEIAQATAQAISKTKALLAYNESKFNEAEGERTKLLSFFDQFKDAVVLVGPTEYVFQDIGPTPIDKGVTPKVSVHGNVIKTLASGIYLKRPLDGNLSVALLILIISVILGYLSVNSATWSSWVGAIILLAFIGLAFFLFAKHHIVIPLAAPATAGALTFFMGLIVMMVVEQKAKGRLKGMFGSYVSADLVDQMVESGEEPHLGGEETAITAFFSDVQAFSSFSELLTPTGLVDLMNEYLTAMTNILQEERGTLDKYIGDAIVAMYGAPIPMKDHAYQSVRTALLMQEKQLELRDKWAMEEDKWGKCYGLVKQMQTRIGCNTGTATVGNMGALDRFNYTMMGDMVNLAARCESGAKAYGAYIMITEETKLASEKTKDDIAFRYLDKIVVKGRSQPVAMYEPTGFMADLGQETQDCLDCFKQGIDKYLLQDWDGALKMFERAKGLEPNKPGVTPGVKDNPSMILIDRCQVMKENPPGDDWDGVYVMTSK